MPRRVFSIRIFVIWALTFWSGLFCAAQNKIDSLGNLLQATSQTEQQIDLHLLIAKEWIIKNRDSAWIHMEEALRLSEQGEFSEKEIESLNMKGNLLQRQSKEEEALAVYDQAIQKAEALNYLPGLAKLYNNVALIHTQEGEYPIALEGFTKATAYEVEIGNLEGQAQGLNNIGVVFYYQGDYDKAMDYFLESVQVHESMGNLLSAKQGYNNIGAINEALGRFEKALSFYQRSLEIALDLEDQAEIGHSYNNIAGVYSNLRQWTKAEEFYRQAMRVNEANEDYYSLALNCLNLADMLPRAGVKDQSLPLFEKAMRLAQEHSYKTLALDLFGKLAKYHADLNNFEEAYHYRGLYDSYKDSVYDEAKAKAIAETEALYETEKKERETAEAKAALAEEELVVQRQNVFLAILIGGLILLVVAGISIYRNQIARRQQLETEAALQEERALAEGRRKLEEERNRISRDLHDHIGAQLTIISSQIDNLAFKESSEERKLKFEEISDHTRDTMAQLRETIWAMHNDRISLSMFSAKLQDFLHRSQREGISLSLFNMADSSLELGPVQTINIFRVCQEAVQNALKYADFERLEIHISAEGHRLQILISDDGKGMNMDEVVQGYGLGNMKSRMEQIDGRFDIESQLEAGTKISLSLALNTAIAL